MTGLGQEGVGLGQEEEHLAELGQEGVGLGHEGEHLARLGQEADNLVGLGQDGE